MIPVQIVPIVEGHGEVTSVPELIRRVWNELGYGAWLMKVREPIRRNRADLFSHAGLIGALDLAVKKAVAMRGS